MSAIERGIRHLQTQGYRVEQLRQIEPHGYLAGTDEARIHELNTFLRRDDVHALFCVRGGYGALRLLPHLDYDAARAHPKLLVGYSDVTALHLAFYQRAGWRGLSGPMVAVEWPEPDAPSEALFWQLAHGADRIELTGPGGELLVPVAEGTHTGTLLGGNLTLVADLVGTPYLPDLTDAILFLEDVGEPPYKIDRLFARLELAGVLDQLGGLVLGGFTECDPMPGKRTLPLEDVFAHYTEGRPYPVARGLQYGHYPVKNTLPIGVQARLTVTEGRAALVLLEPVTQRT